MIKTKIIALLISIFFISSESSAQQLEFHDGYFFTQYYVDGERVRYRVFRETISQYPKSEKLFKNSMFLRSVNRSCVRFAVLSLAYYGKETLRSRRQLDFDESTQKGSFIMFLSSAAASVFFHLESGRLLKKSFNEFGGQSEVGMIKPIIGTQKIGLSISF